MAACLMQMHGNDAIYLPSSTMEKITDYARRLRPYMNKLLFEKFMRRLYMFFMTKDEAQQFARIRRNHPREAANIKEVACQFLLLRWLDAFGPEF